MTMASARCCFCDASICIWRFEFLMFWKTIWTPTRISYISPFASFVVSKMGGHMRYYIARVYNALREHEFGEKYQLSVAARRRLCKECELIPITCVGVILILKLVLLIIYVMLYD